MRFEHGRVPQGAGLGFRENARAQSGPSLGPVWFVVWGDNGRFCLIDSDFFSHSIPFLFPKQRSGLEPHRSVGGTHRLCGGFRVG